MTSDLMSCVILTQGTRPKELYEAVCSALAQQDVNMEVVVVGNGVRVPPLGVPVPAPQRGPVATIDLPDNAGIPAGRNRGVDACSGSVVLFLDDDGWYPSRHLAARVRDAFRADPCLGVLSFRVQDPDGEEGARRHVPRLRAGHPERSSEVTTFLGGACAVRRGLFDQIGGLPEAFFYAHEETDFAWRALNAGYHVRYDGAAVMHHPAAAPTWHAGFYRLNARNRVWLARRNLPWVVAGIYLANWLVITVVRERSIRALRPWLRGFVEGWRKPCGRRRPIAWRTIVRMARAGRPPII